eukprot:CAMPEP_0115475128 /NCGR_PEP_ID=MMETSP0271-20121206/54454_1 /TAXON_ID=71861 /ORGANISM="Scrippsiella trochoidea, Strain CCMP3099" /LENGTH=111 /DNA_ID=CAMNT_0002902485 /DNA_START=410 /DNA_END=741 /DNA_ORIENTATION=+
MKDSSLLTMSNGGYSTVSSSFSGFFSSGSPDRPSCTRPGPGIPMLTWTFLLMLSPEACNVGEIEESPSVVVPEGGCGGGGFNTRGAGGMIAFSSSMSEASEPATRAAFVAG